jgi:hypothetical protein
MTRGETLMAPFTDKALAVLRGEVSQVAGGKRRSPRCSLEHRPAPGVDGCADYLLNKRDNSTIRWRPAIGCLLPGCYRASLPAPGQGTGRTSPERVGSGSCRGCHKAPRTVGERCLRGELGLSPAPREAANPQITLPAESIPGDDRLSG